MSKKSKNTWPKLPKTLKIGHLTIPIISQDSIEINGKTTYAGSHQYGVAIQIKNNHPSKEMEAETLLHEIFHGLFLHSHLEVCDDPVNDSHELIVSHFASNMSMVLKDNPQLVEYLQKAFK